MVLATLLAGVAGCRGGEPGAGPGFIVLDAAGAVDAASDTSADAADAASDASGPIEVPVLSCNDGEALPFADQLSVAEGEFAEAAHRALVNDALLDTTAAFDFAGNPGTAQRVEGVLSVSDTILFPTPLAGETVSMWYFDEAAGDWATAGEVVTDAGGNYAFAFDTPFDPGTTRVYAVFDAARRCYVHNVFVWPEGTQLVLTDIDGTLTLSDEELFAEMSDPSYDQEMNVNADLMMQTWADKGYRVVYLTARPGPFRQISRAWLDRHAFPEGLLITADSLVFGESARIYKRSFITGAIEDGGWEFYAVHGNAESDIQAYEDAGIPKDRTFIIGPEAGLSGTVPIANNDWTSHIVDFIERQPDASQPAELP